jgi:hypothetical protein
LRLSAGDAFYQGSRRGQGLLDDIVKNRYYYYYYYNKVGFDLAHRIYSQLNIHVPCFENSSPPNQTTSFVDQLVVPCSAENWPLGKLALEIFPLVWTRPQTRAALSWVA